MDTLRFDISKGVLTLVFSGDYKLKNLPDDLLKSLTTDEILQIRINAQDLKGWDSSLLALLFQIYQTARAKNIKITTDHLPEGIFQLISLSLAVPPVTTPQNPKKADFLSRFGGFGISVFQTFLKGLKFTTHNLKTFLASFYSKSVMRGEDFLFALQDCGPKALPIVLLISFMVGLILAFVGAVQLQTFGAEIYVASLVTIGMTRIMGAIMVGIIMAGRTGASFAATIGTMQVNEEIDALKTMGVPIDEFLVLPRLSALVLTMPILVMLSDFAGILGGAFVGILALNIPSSEFFKYAYNAWFLKHFLVGVFHALVFGFIIALCGCYFGINCGRDADSVGKATTSAVVYAIVWMIVATGVITFVFQRLGI